MKYLILIYLLASISACTKDSQSSDNESVGKLDVEFVDASSALTNTSLKLFEENSTTADPLIGGLYFGELEIVAYNYRPGEAIQRHESDNGFAGTDWSYWPILIGGYPKTRELILKPKQKLDISELVTKMNPPEDKEFVKSVGEFSLDFLEVYFYRTGIIYNNEFHYSGLIENPDPLFRAPEWSQLPRYVSNPGISGFAGFPGHGPVSDVTQRVSNFSVMFSRSDWFPKPLLVYFDGTSLTSSPALNVEQESILLNLFNQGTQRRAYEHIIIVPYEHHSLALKRERINKEGNVKAAARVQVKFNLNEILEEDSTFSGESAVLKFKRDSNNIPFGLSLTVDSTD